jgi:hypothetical protein
VWQYIADAGPKLFVDGRASAHGKAGKRKRSDHDDMVGADCHRRNVKTPGPSKKMDLGLNDGPPYSEPRITGPLVHPGLREQCVTRFIKENRGASR